MIHDMEGIGKNKGFYNTLLMICQIGYRAIPNLVCSTRRGDDRRVCDPRTSDICENNPSEIGYLLKNISEEERENLKNFTHNDLKLTYDRSGIADAEKYCAKNFKKKPGRWGL